MQKRGLSVCARVQVIEVFIRSEEGLSRDMVKHLNSIEEQVLESRAWTADSALWSALEAAGNKVPSVEEVSVGAEPTAVKVPVSPKVLCRPTHEHL